MTKSSAKLLRWFVALCGVVGPVVLVASFRMSDLTKAVQHVFLIAPALLLPLGAVVLTTRVLPRAFGYLGLAIGVGLQALGLAGVLMPMQGVIDAVLIVQSLWFVAAGVALSVTSVRPAPLAWQSPQR